MDDGEQGLLLDDPRDSAELARALERFLAGRDRWPQMQAGARALAERFDWDGVWRRTREVYEEAAAARAERRRG
jgi:glycosyltransferase involved in cell wall biosynthesis